MSRGTRSANCQTISESGVTGDTCGYSHLPTSDEERRGVRIDESMLFNQVCETWKRVQVHLYFGERLGSYITVTLLPERLQSVSMSFDNPDLKFRDVCR